MCLVFLVYFCLIVGRILNFLPQNNAFWTPRRKTMQNHYEITSKSKFWTRNVQNWTKSLVSGVWFLSPEAGGTLRAVPGEPWRAAAVTALKLLYKNPLEIPKGFPSSGINISLEFFSMSRIQNQAAGLNNLSIIQKKFQLTINIRQNNILHKSNGKCLGPVAY